MQIDAIEVNYLMRCCGVKEINGLSYHHTPEAAMLAFCHMIYPTKEVSDARIADALRRAKEQNKDPYEIGFMGGTTVGAAYEDLAQYSRFRFAIFTESSPVGGPNYRSGYLYRYGQMFADLIRKKGLGSLVATENYELNPNSGRYVKVWVWGIDHAALREWYWYKKNQPKKEKTWVQKAMSVVIGGAENAIAPSLDSPPPTCGSTVANAVPTSNLNVDSTTSGSLLQGRDEIPF